jgi:hypothetical protein
MTPRDRCCERQADTVALVTADEDLALSRRAQPRPDRYRPAGRRLSEPGVAQNRHDSRRAANSNARLA